MPQEESLCLNCKNELNGNYCSNCGQSATVSRITLRETIADFFSASFALEGPLMITLKNLLVNPGKVFREYLAGHRKLYYKPVAFFILLIAIYILLRSVLDYNPVNQRMEGANNSTEVNISLMREAGTFMFRNINNILFLLVFGIAFSLKLFFWRKYLLAEYLAVGFYMSGIYILFGTLAMLWNHFTPYDLASIHLWFLILYITLSSISFFRPLSVGTVFKSILTGFFSLLLYLVLAFGLSLLIVWIS
jgi:hypothetical protein